MSPIDMHRLYKVQQRNCFRTPVRIKMPVEYPDILFDDLFAVLHRIDRKFNSHVDDSVTTLINSQGGVENDEDSVSLFRQVIYWL